MENNYTYEIQEIDVVKQLIEQLDESKKAEMLFPSAKFDELAKQEEEQIFVNHIDIDDSDEDIKAIEEIYNEDQDEEIVKEMLDYELNEVNDDVDKIVLKDVIIILNPQDVIVKKKRNYTDAHRRAQQRYREKYPEKYRELQRNVYNNLKQNDEWRKQYNEKAKETQKKYRDKKRDEKIANGQDVKGRGRPRKETIKKNPDGEIDL
jgi:hypothetical protein